MKCKHCEFEMKDTGCDDDHNGVCCDCFDLKNGMPLVLINVERALQGKPPITKEWPQAHFMGG